MKVLLVKSSLEPYCAYQDTLVDAGFEVIVKSNLVGVEEMLGLGEIPMAVFHHEIPFNDQLLFLGGIHSLPTTSSAYTILSCEIWDPSSFELAQENGVSDFLNWPFHSTELLSKVKIGKKLIEIQSQLTKSQKLETIGQLAAGVAHEINTPIQYIGDNLQFLSDSVDQLVGWIDQVEGLSDRLSRGESCPAEMKKVEKVREEVDWSFLQRELPLALKQSLHGVHQVGRIVGAMKGYSYIRGQEFQLTDLRELVLTAKEVARNHWKYHCEVEIDFPKDWPMVFCLAGEMSQVFLNLLLNAAYAVEQKFRDSTEKGKIRFSGEVTGTHVIVSVSDSGCGIPAEAQSKVFQSFFTTKPAGAGTGQGLSVVKNIVQKHGGAITVESIEGKGTTFFLRLLIRPDDTRTTQPSMDLREQPDSPGSYKLD